MRGSLEGIRDVTEGLWVWRVRHPKWHPGADWQPIVTSGIPAYGPYLFWRDDVPETDLVPVDPGACLPGGLVALYDGRGRKETPLWLPRQRTLVFGDGLTERDGALRVWSTPWHRERVLPALRSMLELPFECVIVSHGEPVHERAAFERALELPPWPDPGSSGEETP
jgi:hypothetical protein